jgi:hypothetical protein
MGEDIEDRPALRASACPRTPKRNLRQFGAILDENLRYKGRERRRVGLTNPSPEPRRPLSTLSHGHERVKSPPSKTPKYGTHRLGASALLSRVSGLFSYAILQFREAD